MPLDKTNEMEQNEFVESPPNNMVCFIVDFSTDWKQRIVFYEVQSPLYSLLTTSPPVLEDVLHKTFPKVASKDENIFFEMTKGSPLMRTNFFRPYTIYVGEDGEAPVCHPDKPIVQKNIYQFRCGQTYIKGGIFHSKILQRLILERSCSQFMPEFKVYSSIVGAEKLTQLILKDFGGKEFVMKSPGFANGKGNFFMSSKAKAREIIGAIKQLCELDRHFLVERALHYDKAAFYGSCHKPTLL